MQPARRFPAVRRDTKDALMPLLVKGTTPSEVAARLGVDLGTATQYLEDACYDGFVAAHGASEDRTWWVSPSVTTRQVGGITAVGELRWPEPGNSPDAAPSVSFTLSATEWNGQFTLSGGEADALARLLVQVKASPWLIGFLTSASMRIESYERGLAQTNATAKEMNHRGQ